MTACSVIGLGKLGAAMAAAAAARGLRVVGVDVDERVVSLVNAGRAPVHETDLEGTIAAGRERLRATMSYREAVLATDVSFVVVPTPSDERGAFSLRYVSEVFREIGRALAEKTGYHTVALTSTVLPGATRHGLLPILEAESGKVAGRDFGLCYSPEFVALGSVIRDFLNPDFLLVGELDERSGDAVAGCYARIVENGAPCVRMSLENAELAKIAVNAFVTTKIGFANMLAELCERIPGGDVDVVTGAIGLDRRIGRRYLTGGLGFGGPCFPRDTVALAFLARALGVESPIVEATDAANRRLPGRVAARLLPLLEPGARVALLGLAYKPESNVVEESQAVEIARLLAEGGARVVAWDPLVAASSVPWLELAASVHESLAGADAVVVATPDPAFRALRAADFVGGRPVTVVDCWRILDGEIASHPLIRYVPLGRSADGTAAAEAIAELWAGEASTRFPATAIPAAG